MDHGLYMVLGTGTGKERGFPEHLQEECSPADTLV